MTATELQAQNDELNAIKDFDLDAWLDEIEPPTSQVTVNTRGDLLSKYSAVQEKIDAESAALHQLAASLPDDEPDGMQTLADTGVSAARVAFDAAKERIDKLIEQRQKISDTYSANRATFTFRNIDPEDRARVMTEHPDHKRKAGALAASEQTMRLFLASIVSLEVTRNGVAHDVDASKWSPKDLTRFLAKIGDGQAQLLWAGYMKLAMEDVTPPFSLASSSGGTTSTS